MCECEWMWLMKWLQQQTLMNNNWNYTAKSSLCITTKSSILVPVPAITYQQQRTEHVRWSEKAISSKLIGLIVFVVCFFGCYLFFFGCWIRIVVTMGQTTRRDMATLTHTRTENEKFADDVVRHFRGFCSALFECSKFFISKLRAFLCANGKRLIKWILYIFTGSGKCTDHLTTCHFTEQTRVWLNFVISA